MLRMVLRLALEAFKASERGQVTAGSKVVGDDHEPG
jgi:hypothetical protein